MEQSVVRALRWVGLEAQDALMALYRAYAALLIDEGIPAGLIGPNEAERVWSRHIADSICFAAPAEGSAWLDVGSGGGLPGLPLAICHPNAHVTLLDRSGRRVDVARRWVRVLGLDNVDVVQVNVDRVTDRYDTLFFRGSISLEAARGHTTRLARMVGIFGLTHSTGAPLHPAKEDGIEIIEIPREVLDSDAALLRIAP